MEWACRRGGKEMSADARLAGLEPEGERQQTGQETLAWAALSAVRQGPESARWPQPPGAQPPGGSDDKWGMSPENNWRDGAIVRLPSSRSQPPGLRSERRGARPVFRSTRLSGTSSMLDTRADKCNAECHLLTSQSDQEYSASVEVMDVIAPRSCARQTVEGCHPHVFEIELQREIATSPPQLRNHWNEGFIGSASAELFRRFCRRFGGATRRF
jgi:hypothetical protein